MRVSLASALLLLSCASVALPALAQPIPTSTADAGPASSSDAGVLPAPMAYDDEATYRRAMDAFVSGRYEEAATAFDEVAAQSPDAGRRGAAAELARQARSRIAGQPAPIPPPPAADSVGVPPAPNTTQPPSELTAPDAERAAPPAASEPERGQGPRAALLTGSTLLGLSLYGAGIPASFGFFDLSDDGRLAVGTYLLVAATSFFVPYLLTSATPPTWGQTSAALHGAYNGWWHGAILYRALAGEWVDEEALLGSMILTSLFEGIGGYALAGYTDMSAGKAHAIETGTALGAGLFAGMTLAIGGEDGEEDVFVWMALLGVAGGGVGGALLADAESLSWGDVEAIQAGAFLGTFAAFTVAFDAELDSARGIAGLLVLGGVGGTVLAERLLAGRDLLAWQGLVLDAATFLGGGAGAGLAFVLGSEDEELTLTVGALAAAAGFGLTLFAFDVPPEEADADADAEGSTTQVSLAPWFDGRGGQGLSVNGRF